MLVAVDPADVGLDMRPPQQRTRTMETVNLSTWSRLAMLAEAVDQLATDPDGQAAVAAAKARFPGWFKNAGIGPGSGWRRWEAAAKRFVDASSKSGQLAATRQAAVNAADAALASLAPAGQVAGVKAKIASKAVETGRKLLAWVRSGKARRRVGTRVPNPTRGRAGALAAGAAGAGAAAAGAGAVAAGATGGPEAARQVFGPGGPMDVGSWSTGSKVLAGLLVGLGAYKLWGRKTAAKGA